MDLNGLSSTGAPASAYIEQYRLGGSNAANGASDFAETLRKTAAGRAAETPPETGSKTVTIDKTDKLYEQCLELEIFMVKTLVNSMRNTVQKSGLIDEGFAGKMYEDMLYDEYAKDFTKNAGFGMADLAYLELTGQRGKIMIR
jgi:flagellar protein FlgJ